ncbi:hypothetical protein E2C01_036059 [Portunus trituberculatus]|uniref:Uncharacterized protein n=1 Tax=Portunus trituberculatus TaxID=210409 RepID=A0A5B7FAU3_PORTR|nr:hypothetical protein [Portunus trituberculatus]
MKVLQQLVVPSDPSQHKIHRLDSINSESPLVNPKSFMTSVLDVPMMDWSFSSGMLSVPARFLGGEALCFTSGGGTGFGASLNTLELGDLDLLCLTDLGDREFLLSLSLGMYSTSDGPCFKYDGDGDLLFF